MQQLQSLQAEVKGNLNSQRTSIKKQTEESVKKVKEDGQTLIDSLQRKEQKRLDRIFKETARLQRQIQKSQDMLSTVRNTIKTSEPHDLVIKHTELERNVKLLANNKTGTDIDTNPVVETSKFVLNRRTLCSTSQIRKCRCELANEFDDFQGAAFINVTSSGLVVITDFKKHLSLSLSYKNTTENPNGVAVMANGKFLEVRWSSHAEVYSPFGKYEGALDTMYGDKMCSRERGINNVKMMPDGRVLLGDYKNSLLMTLKENISLRAIKTSMKALRVTIMSHGLVALSSWEEGKVCVMDIESGRELNTVDIPNAKVLCYHEATDSLVVGRCLERIDDRYAKPGSGVLQQYCATTGGLVGRLATGLPAPQDMAWTPSGYLVLADYKTVKVFKIQEI